jgi:hypothetical protein
MGRYGENFSVGGEAALVIGHRVKYWRIQDY